MEARITYQEVNPALLKGLNQTELAIKASGFDLKLLEMVKYRVSQINGCAFCLDMHHQEAIHLGETELRLHALPAWRECPFYTDAERAALAFAEALTQASTHGIDDALYQNLASHYSKDEVVVLTMAITAINSWNRINKAFGTTPGKYHVGMFG